MHSLFEVEKDTRDNDKLSTLVKTNNKNAQQLETTLILTKAVLGEKKRPASASSTLPAQKIAKPDLIDISGLISSPGCEELVAKIKKQHQRKGAMLHELGPSYWCVIPTNDCELMGLLDLAVHAKIAQTVEQVSTEARRLSKPVQFVLNEGDATWDGITISQVCEAMWEGGAKQVWKELGGADENAEQATKISMDEHSKGENSGPLNREHVLHPKNDFISLTKVAKSQILALRRNATLMAKLVVPFFQVYNNQINFYLQFEFAPDLFAVHHFFEVRFPESDQDVTAVLGLCDAFLVFRGIMEDTTRNVALHKPRPGLITLKPKAAPRSVSL
ncbi:hypothetical protein HDU86_001677 [Geranomyces michiganensis]|nr:hypothetical protein HDU86_001677 [Geranomyces michiganensis]